jgi:hydroxymethylbilane synthase
VTKGDLLLDVSLNKVGDKGFFTKELEAVLLNGEVDFAVHSMKDLPTEITEGLVIAAVTKRHDPRDMLISRDNLTFAQLPKGARIGTSSLRRKSQLLHKRPDLEMVDIRGNIDTRIKKMKTNNYNAIVLAAAGVERLGLEGLITQKLDYSICLPAVGQGALGIETRADDAEVIEITGKVNDLLTEKCVTAERALLRSLEGGCQVPVGAIATVDMGGIVLKAMVASVDGSVVLYDTMEGDLFDSVNLGKELSSRLLERGADEILKKVRWEHVL